MQSSEVREVEERSAPGRMRWSTSVSISYDVLQTCCRTGVPMKEYCQNAAEAGVSEVHLVLLFRSEPSVANPDENCETKEMWTLNGRLELRNETLSDIG